ncbi:hypothetical protein I7I50_12423 [Histoplasma capsulatum G186AR]|uniref:Uncharacterized protein n=1 Tax=Ajellomyces capsulatus TaxID=5037 RepID=A0A8H7YD61_AJECA|nr:hypothetical protein I7I52_11270 [Histoplasma capsulatum]QSS70700.1 hypothetical protein I7I50_12423 [Histoplasma capsulatum G186AR]
MHNRLAASATAPMRPCPKRPRRGAPRGADWPPSAATRRHRASLGWAFSQGSSRRTQVTQTNLGRRLVSSSTVPRVRVRACVVRLSVCQSVITVTVTRHRHLRCQRCLVSL